MKNFRAGVVSGFVFLLASSTTSLAQTFELEPNDSPSQANLILSGVKVTAQLMSNGDVDVFAIDLPAQGALSFVFEKSGTLYDTIAFLGQSGEILGSYDTSATYSFGSYKATVGVPGAGRYYLKIYNRLLWNSGQYALTATFARLVPQIEGQPTNQVAVVGSSATLSVAATGVPPLSYQWKKDGVVILGATNASYGILSTTQASAGRYSVVVSNQNGSVTSSEATLALLDPPKLINLSTLGYLNPDMVSGFVIRGDSPKRILARVVGPGLAPFGITGFPADPVLYLYNSKGNIIAFNDDWSISDGAAMTSVGAFALKAGSKDAALVATLDPGNYTVSANARGYQGMVLLEVYELP